MGGGDVAARTHLAVEHLVSSDVVQLHAEQVIPVGQDVALTRRNKPAGPREPDR